jgi:hypothetical protein
LSIQFLFYLSLFCVFYTIVVCLSGLSIHHLLLRKSPGSDVFGYNKEIMFLFLYVPKMKVFLF